MEDNLITLAIHTYEKALILKSLLEKEGIEVFIQNVNLIQPMVSSGVRVRIKESDLPAALSVVDQAKLTYETNDPSLSDSENFNLKRILAPVDFSSHSYKAAEMAICLAAKSQTEVIFFHSYYIPISTGVLPIEVTFSGDMFNGESLIAIQQKVNREMDHFIEMIHQKMKDNLLPKVKFDTVLHQGIPEEEIIRFSKEYMPSIIVMGTRGKTSKNIDYLGSVTAEVIDRSRIPVLAIPEGAKIKSWDSIHNIGFIAQFNQKDLISFDKLMKIVGDVKSTMHFLHISKNIDVWDEVSLTGMQDYLLKMYPTIEATYGIIDGNNLFKSIEEYIRKYNVDIITLTSNRRNLFSALFYPSIANQMLFHTDTPILVMK